MFSSEGGLGENFGRTEEVSGENSQEPEENTRRRNWTPLQLKNPEYLKTLKNRENTNRDFIMENIVSNDTNVVGTSSKHGQDWSGPLYCFSYFAAQNTTQSSTSKTREYLCGQDGFRQSHCS